MKSDPRPTDSLFASPGNLEATVETGETGGSYQLLRGLDYSRTQPQVDDMKPTGGAKRANLSAP